MNEIIKAMIERRSIRKFKPDAVPDGLLDQIIEAGLYAASARGNSRPPSSPSPTGNCATVCPR